MTDLFPGDPLTDARTRRETNCRVNGQVHHNKTFESVQGIVQVNVGEADQQYVNGFVCRGE